jgi:beta-galactosidase/beta-glucuronidase
MSGRPSRQDGSYPRPQLTRDAWTSLDGQWEFEFDDDDRGLAERWSARGEPLGRSIVVPFCPESKLSGIGDTAPHSVVWYRRVVRIAPPATGPRVLLHFGAVDHACTVWVDGQRVGDHEGGQTPFALDITGALAASDHHVIVVRAVDGPDDLELPRGKQDWQREAHAIWYPRTTGIWQTVWWETVPASAVDRVHWTTDLVAGTVTAEVRLSGPVPRGAVLEVRAELDGQPLGFAAVEVQTRDTILVLRPERLRAGQAREALHWSPENPALADAEIVLRDADRVLDQVGSYFGMRSATVADGTFQLNGVPYFVRSVLEQGYWPDGLQTAPSDEARRREVEVIKELGFNAARIHQKAEDPRFLFWADRLGLILWGETAAAYDFSARAVRLLTAEWLDLVERDRSHPSIVTWVPFNESWGVQDIARDSAQREYVRGLAALTRAVDPTRPVVSNDGWEHVDSDILTLHDYTRDPAVLAARYSDPDAARAVSAGMGPQGRVVSVDSAMTERVLSGTVPIMVSEFGGTSFSGDGRTWGYSLVASAEEFENLLRAQFAALSPAGIAGFCYTQLTDTFQEANGLLTADRRPKIPVEALREIVAGPAGFTWPPPV